MRKKYWFEEHGEVVEGCDGVCYDVFEPFEWVFGLGSLAHEVWVHTAWHGWVLQGCSWDHGLDGKGNSGEVEITADDLLPYDFDHLLANGPYLVDLDLVPADLTSLGVGELMTVFVIIGEKPASGGGTWRQIRCLALIRGQELWIPSSPYRSC